jgi:uncharacterized protein (DUF2141 family)
MSKPGPAFVLLTLLAAAAAASEPVILVRLSGFSSPEGMARIAVFDSEEFWPEDVDFSASRVSSPIDADTVLMTIAGLPPGAYALAAFHDEDADSVFDRGLFRVPTEAYGFSNNVRGTTGPPDFEDALVVLSADTLVLDIELD